MRKIILAAAVIAAIGIINEASAQYSPLTKRMMCSHANGTKRYPSISKKHCLGNNNTANVTYDHSAMVLSVSLPHDSQGGKIEICSSNSGKNTIMVRPGVSVRYNLGNYVKGNCTITVSDGNTVIFYKNISHR